MDFFAQCHRLTAGMAAVVRRPALDALRAAEGDAAKRKALSLVKRSTLVPVPDEVWWELLAIAEDRLADRFTARLVRELGRAAVEDDVRVRGLRALGERALLEGAWRTCSAIASVIARVPARLREARSETRR